MKRREKRGEGRLRIQSWGVPTDYMTKSHRKGEYQVYKR